MTKRDIFHYGKDFYCDNIEYFNNIGNIDYKPIVTPVKLYEFQPYEHTELGTLCKEAGVLFDKSDSSARNKLIKDISQNLLTNLALSKGIQRNVVLDRTAKNATSFYSHNFSATGNKQFAYFDQISMIKNMFRWGRWLNTYILPIYDIATVKSNLTIDYSTCNKWQSSAASELAGGGGASGPLSKIASIISLIAAPTASSDGTLLSNPKWQAKPGAFNQSFPIQFHLINDTTEHLKNNFRFLQNFYSGTIPVAMENSIMQPPNIYMMDIPGRLFWYWTTINIKIEEVGKFRVNSDMNLWLINMHQFKNLQMPKTGVLTGAESWPAWPEAWKVTVNITNLTPDSFTTYAHYLLNGAETDAFRKKKEATTGAMNVLYENGTWSGVAGSLFGQGTGEDTLMAKSTKLTNTLTSNKSNKSGNG